MEQAELELLVNELETRLDRLRALYDQYFMGIERLEPLVPKKDVERRVAVLRKEQIRNTGLRFKFQTIIQRYSTYQTYWFRISRQIELGTYRRDVVRATARFGIDPTKERAAPSEAQASAREPGAPQSAAARRSAPQAAVITEAEMEELEDGTAFLEPLDVESDPFNQIAAPAPPASVPRERFASAVRLEVDELGDPFEEHDPFPKPSPPPTGPKIRIAPRPGASTAPAPHDDHRDTERRLPVAPRIIVAKRSPSLPDAGEVAPPSQRTLAPPRIAPAAPKSAPAAATPAAPKSAPAAPSPAVPPRPAPAAKAAPPLPPPVPAPRKPPPPPAPKAPPPSPPKAAPPAAPARPVGDLSGDRFGEIYSKYVATRREHNEPTHAITRDALAKQLAESTQRLKEKHGGKPIDFEVVVKDGKTILRPVVK